MEVTREMEIHVLHRHHLAVAAPGSAALDAEHRPQRRLADRSGSAHADPVERLGEPDRGRGLAFAERRGGHRRHDDLAAEWPVGKSIQDFETNLGLVWAV